MSIGAEVMLRYLQDWGQSADERIATLNKAVKAAGINAEWKRQNGNHCAFEGPDSERAAEFRTRLHSVWCGEFNAEERAVEALIAEFAASTQGG